MNRRFFLRGAAIAAPALAIPATAAMASSYVEENPSLLALEPELDTVIAEATAAKAAFFEADRIGRGLWPTVPDDIVYEVRGFYGFHADYERQINGHASEADTRRRVYSRDHLVNEVKRLKRKRKITPQVEEDRAEAARLLQVRDTYDADCARAKEVAGYDEANARWTEAARALFPVIARVQAEPCKTMAGIRLKAKALNGWDDGARHFERVVNLDGRERWMPDFCRALVEVLEGS